MVLLWTIMNKMNCDEGLKQIQENIILKGHQRMMLFGPGVEE